MRHASRVLSVLGKRFRVLRDRLDANAKKVRVLETEGRLTVEFEAMAEQSTIKLLEQMEVVANLIVAAPATDIGALAVKAQVVLEYANKEDTVEYRSAVALAKDILALTRQSWPEDVTQNSEIEIRRI